MTKKIYPYPVPTPDRQRIWNAIRELKTFPIGDLIARSRASKQVCREYLRRLVKAGYMTVEPFKSYTLVKDAGVPLPRLNRRFGISHEQIIEDKFWRQLKLQENKSFSAKEFAAALNQVTPPKVKEKEIAATLGLMVEAGYLGKRGNNFFVRPGKVVGPYPIAVMQLTALYDPNIGEVVYLETPRV